jgi:ABC-type transport system involved in cytochrome bd biosynthesis fused ATPase/permease subunit
LLQHNQQKQQQQAPLKLHTEAEATDNNAELPSPSSTAATFYSKNNELSCSNNSSTFDFAIDSPARSSSLYNRTLASIYNSSNGDLSNCAIIGQSGCGKSNLLALLTRAASNDNTTSYSSNKGSANTLSTLSSRPSLQLSTVFEGFARPSDDDNATTYNLLDGALESEGDAASKSEDAYNATSNTRNMQGVSRSASSIALDGLISPPRSR